MTLWTRLMVGMTLGVAFFYVTAAGTFYHGTNGSDDSSSENFLTFHSPVNDLPFTPEQRTVVPIHVRNLEKSFGRIALAFLFIRPTHFALGHLSRRLGFALFSLNPPSEPLYLIHSALLI